MKQIVIHENFLDNELFDEIINYYNLITDHSISSTNNNNNINNWNNFILKDSELIHIKKLPEHSELYKKIEAYIKQKIDYKKIITINFYWYMPGSHIPWHDDGLYCSGLSIYLNEIWDRNHSGYFLYEDRVTNEIKAIIPKKNRAVHQIGGVNHAVTPTTKNSNIRKTIQIFFQ